MNRQQIIIVDPMLIEIEKGFNPREAIIGTLCYELEPVKSMITSIKQAYKEGREVDLLKVVKRGTKYFIRQGHTRFHGLMLAISEGANITQISVILIDYKNEVEEYLENIDGNRSNGLNPVGQAHALAHAISLGYTAEDLAMRYQRSITAIRNMLKILEMPTELQRLISLNKIKKTFAIELMLRNSNDHVKVLEHIKEFINDDERIKETNQHSLKKVGGDEDIPKSEDSKPNLTRKSLGIKRLSHKKTEKLKSEFLDLIKTSDTISSADTLTKITIGKDSVVLFEHLESKNITFDKNGAQITLDSNKLKIFLALLEDDNTAIIVAKNKLNELQEIGELLEKN